MQIFRLRLLLRPKRVRRLPPHQAAVFYAMLCEAYGISSQGKPMMPDGVLLDAPDQGFTSCSPTQPICMGLTVLVADNLTASDRLNSLIDGLRRLGREKNQRWMMQDFTVDRIEDLNSGKAIQAAGNAVAVSDEQIQDQLAAIANCDRLTLHWRTPLRCSRPKSQRREGHQFLDDQYCPAPVIVSRIQRRLTLLGMIADPCDAEALTDDRASHTRRHSSIQTRTLANELVWLDIGYGQKERKTLGGIVGRLTIANDELTEAERLHLILGQYTRLGENTRFGFGHYTIDECEYRAPQCPRSGSLLDVALTQTAIDQVSNELNIESGVLTGSCTSVRTGNYQFDPCFQIAIKKADGSDRLLSIPSQRDRAVGRLVLDVVASSLDAYLESASIAYRRGLGREHAARRLQHFYKQGFQWALKADFFKFFDSIDHRLLQRRIEAYFPDPPLVQYLMAAVKSGSPTSETGLPTGSPLSPMLANLFLDHFDEQIEALGGKLIRYADDFLVLFRDQEQAAAAHRSVSDQAKQLLLALNEDKTAFLTLGNGFQFLGFQFYKTDQWQTNEDHGPVPVEEIGWQDASKRRAAGQSSGSARQDKRVTAHRLTGESDLSLAHRNASLIVGPEVSRISLQGDRLVLELNGGGNVRRIAIDHLQSLTLIGDASFDWRAVQGLTRRNISIVCLDQNMRVQCEAFGEQPLADAIAVQAQAELHENALRRLELSRELIASKINNHAVLGSVSWKHSGGAVHDLYELSQRSLQAQTPEELLGIEGRAAAIWYGRLGELLGQGFTFEHRVAPDAHDPVNAMLNWAHTLVYRWTTHSVIHAGLVPTLGVLHQARAGHLTLASDLQEPFRHLAERVVIQASKSLRPTDFVEDRDGKFPLSMKPRARAQFLTIFHQAMSQNVTGAAQSEPAEYRNQIRQLARRFRCVLLNPTQPLKSFWHPSPITQSIPQACPVVR